MLPLWTVNDFISSIKQTHFDTLRDKYQIPVHIPIRLPYKSEKFTIGVLMMLEYTRKC